MQAQILQEVLLLVEAGWRVHNCKLLSQKVEYDAPMAFLSQYDLLEDSLKQAYPLDFGRLKHMDTPMTTAEAEAFLGLEKGSIKPAWHIKVVGSVVLACEPLQLAVRLHFSNTSKPMQAVHAPSQLAAWQSEAVKWRTFGVVDVLYKGNLPLESHADDALKLLPAPAYQALPSEHSLSITSLVNENKEAFAWVDSAIVQRVL